jgi:alkanesulfonate monooxygenase SsuD/methylene tetrahydromethanopterin reductase-like flavin-dependent oxidoreductase (luciferase family)
MTAKEELRRIKADQIKTKRDGAERARRLGRQFWSAEDRDRALRLAEELDAQADELERAFSNESAAGPIAAQTPKVTQTQMQVQQGPPAEEAPAKDKGSDKPD